METEYNSQHNNYIELGISSDDDDDYYGESSDEDGNSTIRSKELKASANSAVHNNMMMAIDINPQPLNLVQKLFNRERTNHFSGQSHTGQLIERAFIEVPNRLSFCLKDILNNRYLQGHVFMGLTACGQFLLSYKVCCNDNSTLNHYSFNVGYKYTLFFWIYQPHKPLSSYFQCCLFDDHGVDNIKNVTMTQWKNADTRVLIVHGGPVDKNDDSYITYVKVPKLGCLECKKLRDSQDYFHFNAHCLNCNLTVHTKYSSNTDTDPKFQPYINLLCPERILIIANGYLHMLRIDIELPAIVNQSNAAAQVDCITSTMPAQLNPGQTLVLAKSPAVSHDDDSAVRTRQAGQQQSIEVEIKSHGSGVNVSSSQNSNVIARIFDDFTAIETDPNCHRSNNETKPQQQRQEHTAYKTTEELVLTSNSSSSSDSGSSSKTPTPSKAGSNPIRISLKRKRHDRIVTKSYRNGIVTVDLQGPTSSTSTDKSNAYEFSEDNEKCEMISTLRKRRLAEKKYEFSEDNSENIIPFTKMRSAVKSRSLAAQLFNANNNNNGGSGGSAAHSSNRSLHRFSPTTHCFYNSPCASPSSSPHPSAAQSPCSINNDARHYMSPSPNSPHMEFRSPPSCPSPASSSVMRSPNRQPTAAQIFNQKSPPLSQATLQMLSYKPLGALSPLQVSMTKRLDLGGSMSPNTGMSFMSPRREEQRIVEVPLQGDTMPEKPICTKKLKRRYVEEDDATSVITSEEDDCISPGYHTSLPVEVHGACYSEMQMISQASYQRIRCASVVITQHSFDLETFTYYVISILCQKNQKTYDVFYDWAYEVINVCPLSQTVSCLLMAQFSARDVLPITPTNCLNCTSKFDCMIHRRQYECRILFTWNMETGKWQVLDYGEMKEFFEDSPPIKRYGSRVPLTFPEKAKILANDVSTNLTKLPDYKSNLRVLGSDIKKSKQSISDLDNMIEFNLKRRVDV